MNGVHKVVLAEIVAVVVLMVLAAMGITKPTSSSTPSVQVTLIGQSAASFQVTIYGADWCSPCKRYIASIKSAMPKDGWIIRDATDKDAATAHIVIDKRDASISANKIEQVPCTVFRRDGKEVKRVYGAMSPDDLAKTFNELGKGTQ